MTKKITLKNHIQNIIVLVNQNCTEDVDAEWLNEIIDKYHNKPKKHKSQEQTEEENKPTFEQLLDEFQQKHMLLLEI